MTEAPQPAPNDYTKVLVWALVGVAIFILCLASVVCLGPFVMFAWIVDRQADWFEQQGPAFSLIGSVLGRLT